MKLIFLYGLPPRSAMIYFSAVCMCCYHSCLRSFAAAARIEPWLSRSLSLPDFFSVCLDQVDIKYEIDLFLSMFLLFELKLNLNVNNTAPVLHSVTLHICLLLLLCRFYSTPYGPCIFLSLNKAKCLTDWQTKHISHKIWPQISWGYSYLCSFLLKTWLSDGRLDERRSPSSSAKQLDINVVVLKVSFSDRRMKKLQAIAWICQCTKFSMTMVVSQYEFDSAWIQIQFFKHYFYTYLKSVSVTIIFWSTLQATLSTYVIMWTWEKREQCDAWNNGKKSRVRDI